MTKTLFKLHLRMWRRSFRGDLPLTFTALFVVVGGLLASLFFGAMTYFAVELEGETSFAGLSAGVGFLSLIYIFLVLAWPSAENQLDARKFATLPLTSTQLLPGLAIASILQSRGLTALVGSAIIGGFAANVAPNPAAAVGLFIACVIQAVIAVVLGEAIGSIADAVAGRVWAERIGMGVSFVFVGLFMLINFGFDPESDSMSLPFEPMGAVFSWTPVGSAVGAVASGIEGQIPAATAKTLITVATLVVSAWLWLKAVGNDLRQPIRSGGSQKARAEHGLLLPYAPATPVGALYSRILRYWRRDSRLLYNGLTLLLVAAFLVVIGIAQDNPAQWYAPFLVTYVVFMVFGNTFGFDGPANWVNMVAGVRGKDMVNAIGLAALTLHAPVMLVILAVLVIVNGFTPPMLGVAVFAIMALLQASFIAPALAMRFPFQTSPPGTSPMKQRSGYSSGALILSIFGFVYLVQFIPGAALLIFGFESVDSFAGANAGLVLAGFVLQAVVTAGLGWLGWRWAANNLDQRWPKIFAKVRSWA